MLPPIYCGSFSSTKSSSGDSKLLPDEANPLEVSIPYVLISSSHLAKIICQYHIPPDFICKVLDSDEFILTPGPLEVAFMRRLLRPS